jgi:hypothetical protein
MQVWQKAEYNATKEGQAGNRRVEIGVSANKQMIDDAKAQAN